MSATEKQVVDDIFAPSMRMPSISDHLPIDSLSHLDSLHSIPSNATFDIKIGLDTPTQSNQQNTATHTLQVSSTHIRDTSPANASTRRPIAPSSQSGRLFQRGFTPLSVGRKRTVVMPAHNVGHGILFDNDIKASTTTTTIPTTSPPSIPSGSQPKIPLMLPTPIRKAPGPVISPRLPTLVKVVTFNGFKEPVELMPRAKRVVTPRAEDLMLELANLPSHNRSLCITNKRVCVRAKRMERCHVEELDVSGCAVESPLVPGGVSAAAFLFRFCATLPRLQQLRLTAVQLSQLPSTLPAFPCLRELDVSCNTSLSVSDVVALVRSTHRTLRCFRLSACALTELPREMCLLSVCHTIDVSDNMLDTKDLVVLAGCPVLESLCMANNNVNELRLPSTMPCFLSLKTVDLRSNQITAIDWACVVALPVLRQLNISNNPISVSCRIKDIFHATSGCVSPRAFPGLDRRIEIVTNEAFHGPPARFLTTEEKTRSGLTRRSTSPRPARLSPRPAPTATNHDSADAAATMVESIPFDESYVPPSLLDGSYRMPAESRRQAVALAGTLRELQKMVPNTAT